MATATNSAGGGAAAVDGDRHLREIAGEGDQIEEGREEDQISEDAEQQIECARHGDVPSHACAQMALSDRAREE